MAMFSVSVARLPAVRLFGVSVRTDMSRASEDCPKLWEKVFGPRMHEIGGQKPGGYQGPLYGISVMLEGQNFEYWAAMPAPEGPALPDGMRQIELDAGFYAGCALSSLSQLGEAYLYLYEEWPKSTQEYAINMQAPNFEYYGSEYLASGAFDLYVPLVKI